MGFLSSTLSQATLEHDALDTAVPPNHTDTPPDLDIPHDDPTTPPRSSPRNIFWILLLLLMVSVMLITWITVNRTTIQAREKNQFRKIQNYLRRVHIHVDTPIIQEIDQQQNNSLQSKQLLRTLGNTVGWRANTIQTPLPSLGTASPHPHTPLSCTFYPVLPFESADVTYFNPTYLPTLQIYLCRTFHHETHTSGYCAVKPGAFTLNPHIQQPILCLRGTPYAHTPISQASAQTPNIEDLRYIDQHAYTKRIFLSGTLVHTQKSSPQDVLVVQCGLLEYIPSQEDTDPPTLNIIDIVASPARTFRWEKNWLWSIHPQTQHTSTPRFRVLYDFYPQLHHFEYDLFFRTFTYRQSSYFPFPPIADIHVGPTRGSALLALPQQYAPAHFLLLTHRRSSEYHYFYNLSVLNEQQLHLSTIPLPVLLEKPFRILFVLSMHLSHDHQELSFCAGIEDQVACIFVYQFAQIMKLFPPLNDTPIVPLVSTAEFM